MYSWCICLRFLILMHVCMMHVCMLHVSMILDPWPWGMYVWCIAYTYEPWSWCMCVWCSYEWFIYSWSLTLMHVSVMRDFFVSDGRTDEQADSRSWISTYLCTLPNLASNVPYLVAWGHITWLQCTGCPETNYHCAKKQNFFKNQTFSAQMLQRALFPAQHMIAIGVFPAGSRKGGS